MAWLNNYVGWYNLEGDVYVPIPLILYSFQNAQKKVSKSIRQLTNTNNFAFNFMFVLYLAFWRILLFLNRVLQIIWASGYIKCLPPQ